MACRDPIVVPAYDIICHTPVLNDNLIILARHAVHQHLLQNLRPFLFRGVKQPLGDVGNVPWIMAIVRYPRLAAIGPGYINLVPSGLPSSSSRLMQAGFFGTRQR